MKKRNPSIELYRCLLMFGIVMVHVIGQGPYIHKWFAPVFGWCVCGFVFISGYFGVRFKPSKMLSLVALGLFCSVVSILMAGGTIIEALRGVTNCGNYWFLWAYILLMLFSPVLNKAIEVSDKRMAIAIFVPLAIVSYGWMLLLAVPHVRDFMPHAQGLSHYCFVPFIAIYLGVGFYRKFDLQRFLSLRVALVGSMICALCFCLGLWYHWWIAAFVFSAILFKCFERLTMPAWLGRLTMFIAPSMFSVYLLHFSAGGY